MDLLDATPATEHYKAKGLDLSPVLAVPEEGPPTDRYCRRAQDHGLDKALDHRFIDACRPAIEEGRAVVLDLPISNVDRTVGTLLGHAVTARRGGAGLPDDTITITFRGSAGQSFGAFVPRGVTLRLVGDANDCSGDCRGVASWCVRPTRLAASRPKSRSSLATSSSTAPPAGEVFRAGPGGQERFCVRNSGATAVVEGVGDHGCEYMTGGRVVVLGPTGRNFGAGMSGGIAYVYDPDRSFPERVNPEMVELEPLDDEDTAWLTDIVTRHRDETGSALAGRLLEEWETGTADFVKVMPRDYRRVLEATRRAIAEGTSVDDAVMAASRL